MRIQISNSPEILTSHSYHYYHFTSLHLFKTKMHEELWALSKRKGTGRDISVRTHHLFTQAEAKERLKKTLLKKPWGRVKSTQRKHFQRNTWLDIFWWKLKERELGSLVPCSTASYNTTLSAILSLLIPLTSASTPNYVFQLANWFNKLRSFRLISKSNMEL